MLAKRKDQNLRTAVVLFLVMLAAGCGGGSDGSNGTPPLPANRAPQFTGPSTFSAPENQSSSFQIEVSDPDGNAVTLSIIGGPDAALFVLDSPARRLSPISPFDFEFPRDSDTNNEYAITISAGDGQISSNQTFRVSVTNVVEDFFEEQGGVAIVPDATVGLHDMLGVAFSDAGDLDGDGKGDILIGAPANSPTIFNPGVGSAYFVEGSVVTSSVTGIVDLGTLPVGSFVRIDGPTFRASSAAT